MELLFIPVIMLVFAVAFGVYWSDRPGWNATFKRISRISRAELEAKKEPKALTARVPVATKDAWEAEFTGKQIESKPKEKHYVVKTWYQKVSTGELWPYAKCGCGHEERSAVISDGMKPAERRCREKINDHIRTMNEAENLLKKNNGQFAF